MNGEQKMTTANFYDLEMELLFSELQNNNGLYSDEEIYDRLWLMNAFSNKPIYLEGMLG